MTDFRINQRVQVDKFKATVRYVGPVQGQQGVWVGLEWDDVGRGKHDGSSEGRRYFSTRSGEESGSFVRRPKLQATAETGCTVLQALHKKYDANRQDNGTHQSDIRIGGKAVQLVGMEKLRRQRGGIDMLHEVALLDAFISSAGVRGDLGAAAPAIEDLDLSNNLLGCWEDVEALCRELPALHTLNVSQNLLAAPTARPSMQFPTMQRLVLNQSLLGIDQVFQQLPSFPQLEELHLCGNRITDLSFNPDLCQQLTNLKTLDLENNMISDWQEVCRLQSLPALERLLLSGNKISSLAYYTPGTGQGVAFPCLASLTLGGNCIQDWASIDSLHMFPRLQALRLGGNPHPGDTPGRRYEVIARIGKLTALNGSTISASERKDCELQYLRAVAGQQHSPCSPAGAEASNMQQPRLAELKQRYGEVGAAVVADNRPRTLGADMLRVKLVCHAGCTAAQGGTLTKKLPGSLVIGKLKQLCERLFKIPPTEQVLWLSANGGKPEEVTHNDSRELAFYHVTGELKIEVMAGTDRQESIT